MTTAMTLRIDAEIKKEATKYLEQIGLSTSEAVRLFLYSVVRHKGLPFEINVPNKETERILNQVESGEQIDIPTSPLDTDLVIDSSDLDFASTGLRVLSTLQLHRLMTGTKSLLQRELGALSPAMQAQVQDRLRNLFDLNSSHLANN